MSKKIVTSLLIVFLLIDLGYSFLQYYNTPLDGDMASGIVPAEDVKQILKSPLGLDVLFNDQLYPNPNRYFSHVSMYGYFSYVPLFLQNFTDPVTSIYLSCALLKLLIQIGLIVLLSFFITGKKKITFDVLMVAALISPIFQANYHEMDIGIIDKSSSYVFFYGYTFLFILLYFLPFYRQFINPTSSKIPIVVKICWIPLALVTSLSGPLNTGVALIVSFLLFSWIFMKGLRSSEFSGFKLIKDVFVKIPSFYWFYLIPISVFSLYSLYIGSYNSIGSNEALPLGVMYQKMVGGCNHYFIQNIGYRWVYFSLVINYSILYFFDFESFKKVIQTLFWIVLFSIVYLLLLPLGGYRLWRPEVIRYDTAIPVTLAMIFLFGSTTHLILSKIQIKKLSLYLPLLVFILIGYQVSDILDLEKDNCERDALTKIYQQKLSYSDAKCECAVMSWSVEGNATGDKVNQQVLEKWNVVERKE